MYSITLAWSPFRAKIDSSGSVIKYADARGNYYLYTTIDSVDYVCVLDKSNASDFETNYKAGATALI